MTLYSVDNPFQSITTPAGIPLTGGSIFIGLPNQDPETNPQPVFWDQAGTIPAAQPLTTKGGYIVRAGSPAIAYTAQPYSMRVRDRFAVEIFYQAKVSSQLSDFIGSLAGDAGAGEVGYLYSSTYLSNTVGFKLQEWLSVKDAPFNAKGDGTTNDAAAIQAADNAATALGVSLWFPPGRYIVGANQVFRGGCSWYGASRYQSVIAAAAVTFTNLSGLVSCQSHSDHATKDMGFDLTNGIFPAGTGNPGNIYWAIAFQLCTDWTFSNCAVMGIQPHCQGLAVDAGSFFQITDNYFRMPSPSGSYCQAINISFASGLPTDYTVSRNIMRGCGFFTNGARGIIAHNAVTDWQFGGGLTFGPNVGCANHTIIGNRCTGGNGKDINDVYPSGIESWSSFDIIADNFCLTNAGDGIGFGGFGSKVSNNVCPNNGQGAAGVTGTGSGVSANSITISGNNYYASESLVSDNILSDLQTTPTQKYGYAEYVVSGPALYNVHLHGNKITGYATAPLLLTNILRSFIGPRVWASATLAPGVIGASTPYSVNVSCPGARRGDHASASYNGDATGTRICAQVNNDDFVTVLIDKFGAGPDANLTSAAITVSATKPPSYGKYW